MNNLLLRRRILALRPSGYKVTKAGVLPFTLKQCVAYPSVEYSIRGNSVQRSNKKLASGSLPLRINDVNENQVVEKYSISGQSKQASDNLILFPYWQATTDVEINGITWSFEPQDSVEDGTPGLGILRADGYAKGDSVFRLAYFDKTSPTAAKLPIGEYTLSGCPSNGGTDIWSIQFGSSQGVFEDSGSGVTFSFDEDMTLEYIDCVIKSGVEANDIVFRPMLNSGSTSLPYKPFIPYAENPIPILSVDSYITLSIYGGSTISTTLALEDIVGDYHRLQSIDSITDVVNVVYHKGTLFNRMKATLIKRIWEVNDGSTTTITNAKPFSKYLVDNGTGGVANERGYITPPDGSSQVVYVLNKPYTITLNDFPNLEIYNGATTIECGDTIIPSNFSLIYSSTSGNQLPTPEVPIEIKSCGDLVTDIADSNYGKYKVNVTSTSPNILKLEYYPNSITTYGVTFTSNADGSVRVKGRATQPSWFNLLENSPSAITLNGNYRLSGCPSGGTDNTYKLQVETADGMPNILDIGNGVRFSKANATVKGVYIGVYPESGIVDLLFMPMLTLYDECNYYLDEPLRAFSGGTDTIDNIAKLCRRETVEYQLPDVPMYSAYAFPAKNFYGFSFKASSMRPALRGSGWCSHLKNTSNSQSPIWFGIDSQTVYMSFPKIYQAYDNNTDRVNAFKRYINEQRNDGTPIVLLFPADTATTNPITPSSIDIHENDTILDSTNKVKPLSINITYQSYVK